MKALEKDRTRRYETASGFARDIQRYLARRPGRGRPAVGDVPAAEAGAKAPRGAGDNRRGGRRCWSSAAAVSTWQAVRARRPRYVPRMKRFELPPPRPRPARRDPALVTSEADAVAQRNTALESKKEADKQATIAMAVNDFLQKDLLAEAAPDKNARNKKVTVEELLVLAAANIGGKFEKQPEIEAAIRLTIGRTLNALGLLPEAREHLVRAVELRQRKYLGQSIPTRSLPSTRLAKFASTRENSPRPNPCCAELQNSPAMCSDPNIPTHLNAWMYWAPCSITKASRLRPRLSTAAC